MKRLLCWFVLLPIVRRNYRLRELGRAPDCLHWADGLLLRLGGIGMGCYDEFSSKDS